MEKIEATASRLRADRAAPTRLASVVGVKPVFAAVTLLFYPVLLCCFSRCYFAVSAAVSAAVIPLISRCFRSARERRNLSGRKGLDHNASSNFSPETAATGNLSSCYFSVLTGEP
jgi:hypothetical protein